ncbi:hypothetical protein BH11VER1_BH11VER1_07340 [soil metagenome]
MKQIPGTVKILAALAFTALTVSCATHMEAQQDLAVTAGFKVITPVKPDQVALLPTLPKDHVTRINYRGKTYYVLPDLENNKAYVGGPAEYERYDQIRLAKQIDAAHAESKQMDQMETYNQMNWGAWGGWGGAGWGGMGAPVRARPYRR